MSPQKERVHKVPGKSCCRVRKSKQSVNRRAQVIERALLSAENGLMRSCKRDHPITKTDKENIKSNTQTKEKKTKKSEFVKTKEMN